MRTNVSALLCSDSYYGGTCRVECRPTCDSHNCSTLPWLATLVCSMENSLLLLYVSVYRYLAVCLMLLLLQVLARDGSGGDPPPARQEPDPDTADAMGCFASPKRLGHHGSISDVCVISYEPNNVSVLIPYYDTSSTPQNRSRVNWVAQPNLTTCL